MSLFGRGRDERPDSPAPAKPKPPAAAAATVPTPAIQSDPTPRRHAPAPARTGGHDVTHVGRSVVVKGDLSGDEDLTIEGTVKGRVDLPDHQLTIGADGQIDAEVTAQAVIVVGHVAGNITATERVEIHDTGTVTGDIRAPRLLIHEGAVINGSIDMRAPDAPEVPKPDKASKAEKSQAAEKSDA